MPTKASPTPPARAELAAALRAQARRTSPSNDQRPRPRLREAPGRPRRRRARPRGGRARNPHRGRRGSASPRGRRAAALVRLRRRGWRPQRARPDSARPDAAAIRGVTPRRRVSEGRSARRRPCSRAPRALDFPSWPKHGVQLRRPKPRPERGARRAFWNQEGGWPFQVPASWRNGGRRK
jgi:hypothetical protein